MAQEQLLKLIIIGDQATGKSSILHRFTENEFPRAPVQTIGVGFGAKTLEIDGKQLKLQIWDTAGSERFRSVTRSYYRGAVGALIVFDVTNIRSFQNISTWFNDVITLTNCPSECVIVGNKCDIIEREVDYEEALELAESLGTQYVEVSAKEGINIEAAFISLLTGERAKAPPGTKMGRKKLNTKLSIEGSSNNSSTEKKKAGSQLIPLKSLHIQAFVIDRCSEVNVTTTYTNFSSDPVEVSYTFPLTHFAALPFITRFTARNLSTDTTLVSVVTEKENIENLPSTDQETIQTGYFLHLTEENGKPIFKATVGTVDPGEELSFSISYIIQLTTELEKHHFLFPTTSLFQISRPTDFSKSDVDTSINFEIIMPSEIIAVEAQHAYTSLTLTTDLIAANHCLVKMERFHNDLELLITTRNPLSSRGWLELNRLPNGTTTASAVTCFYPSSNLISAFSTSDEDPKIPFSPFDFIFLIDRSESMAGEKWKDLTLAITVALHSLPPGCSFQIIGFGTSYEKLFPLGNTEYTDESLIQALKLMKNWSANLGGRNVFAPLYDIFRSPASHKHRKIRRVILITDAGEFANGNDIVRLVCDYSTPLCRVHTLGIGLQNSEGPLFKRISVMGYGSFEATLPRESVQQKLTKLLQASMEWQLKNVSIEKGVTEAWNPIIYPIDFSNVTTGNSFLVYSLFQEFPNPPPNLDKITLSLTGTVDEVEIRCSADLIVDYTNPENEKLQRRILNRRSIANRDGDSDSDSDIESLIKEIQPQTQRKEFSLNEIARNTIISRLAASWIISTASTELNAKEISLQYQIPSRLTAFVALPVIFGDEKGDVSRLLKNTISIKKESTNTEANTNQNIAQTPSRSESKQFRRVNRGILNILDTKDKNIIAPVKKTSFQLHSNNSRAPATSLRPNRPGDAFERLSGRDESSCCGGGGGSSAGHSNHDTSLFPDHDSPKSTSSFAQQQLQSMSGTPVASFENLEEEKPSSEQIQFTNKQVTTVLMGRNLIASSVMSTSVLSTGPLYELISLQQAIGCWELDGNLADILKKPLEELALADRLRNLSSLWATSLALTWLEQFHFTSRQSWLLVHRKGMDWLRTSQDKTDDIVQWLMKAKEVLSG